MRAFNYTATIALLLLTCILAFGQGCSKLAGQTSSSSTGTSQTKASECAAPAGVSGQPKTIEEAVALVNALPMPVSVGCFLESLDRPLKVVLTESTTSAQPAAGRRSPRVFIFSGELIISVVPAGFGSEVVEFGQRTGPDTTIKAEIAFPVTAPLAPDAPYSRILDRNGRTGCALCHNSETRVGSIAFAEAFQSRAFRPREELLVELPSLKLEWQSCDPKQEPARCKILDGMFGFGPVQSTAFPAEMPTFF